MITTDRVKTSRMVNSYRTNVGNTCSPVRNSPRKWSLEGRQFLNFFFPYWKVFRMEDVAFERFSITISLSNFQRMWGNDCTYMVEQAIMGINLFWRQTFNNIKCIYKEIHITGRLDQQVERSTHSPIDAKKIIARKSLTGSMQLMTSLVTMWPCEDSSAPARKQPSSMETSRKSVT